MIQLQSNDLVVSFPEVHPEARCRITFYRTLRIPDDDKSYPLPPGLETFPLRMVDEFAEQVPADWLRHGGVMFPMYQSEAVWLGFGGHWVEDRSTTYPFALKIAAGKANAVTGGDWSETLESDPQDYVVVPEQPWLDGFVVERGFIRQFVAMPLGAGYSAEEQLTGKAEFGGLQILAMPMKREVFERRYPEVREEGVLYSRAGADAFSAAGNMGVVAGAPDMGLAPGGRMRQEIYDDPFELADWDQEHASRCFVHLTNSLVWRAITGTLPPTVPPTAEEYTRAGLPWFEYYNDSGTAVDAQEALKGLKSVTEMAEEKGDKPLPENTSVTAETIIEIRKGLKPDQVREGRI
jgi:hypothetical protein